MTFASVLGALVGMEGNQINLTDINASNYPKMGRVYHLNNFSNIIGAPTPASTSSCIVWVDNRSGYIQQYIQELQGQGRLFVRDVEGASLAQDNWIQVTAPSYLKSYSNLSSLASALGVFKFETYTFEAGETKTLTISNALIFLIHVQNYNVNLLINKYWGGFKVVSASNEEYTSYLQISMGSAGDKFNITNLRNTSDSFTMLILK